LEVGLRPSKLVWGGYFAGFRLLVNGISDNCRCVISDEPSALAAILMKARARTARTPPTNQKKNTRFFIKVRADFHESLHSVSLTDLRTVYFGKKIFFLRTPATHDFMKVCMRITPTSELFCLSASGGDESF
jgi:hypothetical protein